MYSLRTERSRLSPTSNIYAIILLRGDIMDKKKSLLTDYGKQLVKKNIEELEERKKFIGPPLPYEMAIKRIRDKK